MEQLRFQKLYHTDILFFDPPIPFFNFVRSDDLKSTFTEEKSPASLIIIFPLVLDTHHTTSPVTQ